MEESLFYYEHMRRRGYNFVCMTLALIRSASGVHINIEIEKQKQRVTPTSPGPQCCPPVDHPSPTGGLGGQGVGLGGCTY